MSAPCELGVHDYRVITIHLTGGHILAQCKICLRVDDFWASQLEIAQKKHEDHMKSKKEEPSRGLFGIIRRK